jgi:hypothetical protein
VVNQSGVQQGEDLMAGVFILRELGEPEDDGG